MFEKRLKEISEKLGEESLNEFYILTHKKHTREIYFTNNKQSINFLEIKFDPSMKKFRNVKSLVYFLIKAGWLQPFLKKLKLSSKLGQVIFVGGQIKGFDFKNKEIISIPLKENSRKEFLALKKDQKVLGGKNFAPKITQINKKIPYSKEELLNVYRGGKEKNVFERLMEFYNYVGIKEIPIGKYIRELKGKIEKKKILSKSASERLDFLSKKNLKLLVTTLHGDFAKENVLIKRNDFVFSDFSPYEGLITNSLVNYFRDVRIDLKNSKFKRILEKYPKEVQKNIEVYLELSKIELFVKKKI